MTINPAIRNGWSAADQAGSPIHSDLTQGEKDSVRHNWSRLGFAHWFNDYGTEFWRHPQSQRVLEFYEWS